MYCCCLKKLCFGILIEKWGILFKKQKAQGWRSLMGIRDLLREDKNFWAKSCDTKRTQSSVSTPGPTATLGPVCTAAIVLHLCCPLQQPPFRLDELFSPSLPLATSLSPDLLTRVVVCPSPSCPEEYFWSLVAVGRGRRLDNPYFPTVRIPSF